MAKVIVTGASGFIGGQTALQLHDSGHEVVGIDIVNPSKSLNSIFSHFINSDFAGNEALEWIYRSDAVAIVHCAGTSLVAPSIENPFDYYTNNFVRSKRMMDSIVQGKRQDIRVIFSSSAAVYGEPVMGACQEEDPPLPISPYGESKLMVEWLMQSYFRAYKLQPVMFRYFNACGADPQGRHGQPPMATHIIARVLESIKTKEDFTLYGTDYPTADGTCVRDYVHVEDIARAHVLAVTQDIPTGVYNLGSNKGVSNQEIIAKAQEITGQQLSVIVGDARPGDPSVLTANSSRFDSIAGNWRQHSLEDIITHAWAWYNRQ
jgi:UDP-glucose 4-epimerase